MHTVLVYNIIIIIIIAVFFVNVCCCSCSLSWLYVQLICTMSGVVFDCTLWPPFGDTDTHTYVYTNTYRLKVLVTAPQTMTPAEQQLPMMRIQVNYYRVIANSGLQWKSVNFVCFNVCLCILFFLSLLLFSSTARIAPDWGLCGTRFEHRHKK